MGEQADNFFKRRREELGLTQRAIAALIGLTDAAVAAWERDASFPRRSIWALVAAAYQVTEQEIAQQAIAATATHEP